MSEPSWKTTYKTSELVMGGGTIIVTFDGEVWECEIQRRETPGSLAHLSLTVHGLRDESTAQSVGRDLLKLSVSIRDSDTGRGRK